MWLSKTTDPRRLGSRSSQERYTATLKPLACNRSRRLPRARSASLTLRAGRKWVA